MLRSRRAANHIQQEVLNNGFQKSTETPRPKGAVPEPAAAFDLASIPKYPETASDKIISARGIVLTTRATLDAGPSEDWPFSAGRFSGAYAALIALGNRNGHRDHIVAIDPYHGTL